MEDKDITVLYIEPNSVLEDLNKRQFGSRGIDTTTHGIYKNVNYDDPALWSPMAFGRSLQQGLQSGLGAGFSIEVTDFGKYVSVRTSYHNHVTGRSASKIFLVVFEKDGDGIVMSTANRWRSISGTGQALSYIRSASMSLKDSTNNKI